MTLGRAGREYEKRYGKYYLKTVNAVPSFIVTFSIPIDEVTAKASEAARDEGLELITKNTDFKPSKENFVVKDDEPEPAAQPAPAAADDGPKIESLAPRTDAQSSRGRSSATSAASSARCPRGSARAAGPSSNRLFAFRAARSLRLGA